MRLKAKHELLLSALKDSNIQVKLVTGYKIVNVIPTLTKKKGRPLGVKNGVKKKVINRRNSKYNKGIVNDKFFCVGDSTFVDFKKKSSHQQSVQHRQGVMLNATRFVRNPSGRVDRALIKGGLSIEEIGTLRN